jgi:hypothetical protein
MQRDPHNAAAQRRPIGDRPPGDTIPLPLAQ